MTAAQIRRLVGDAVAPMVVVGMPMILVTLVVVGLLVRGRLTELEARIGEAEEISTAKMADRMAAMSERMDETNAAIQANNRIAQTYIPVIRENERKTAALAACRRTRGCVPAE